MGSLAKAHWRRVQVALLRRHAEAQSGVRRMERVANVGSFHDYVMRRNPDLLRYEHIGALVDVGERVARGELKRVICTMPPGYFKSEVWSRLFSGYYVRRYLDRYAAVVAHSATLAWNLSDESRAYYRQDGGEVSAATDAKNQWDTTGRGGIWATGAGANIIGQRYHLGVLDDPVDPEKAHSPTYQRRFRSWWPGKFLSRQEPDAAIVVVMQRLGNEDPVDFLYRREVGKDTDEAPEHWHVVVCDEIKSDAPLGTYGGPRGLPSTCTIEPDRRKVGMVLAPSRYSEEQVKHLQLTAGAYVRAAQRQQRPAKPQGDFWQKDDFELYDVLPEDAYNGGKDWDTAYTDKKDANAASAWVESYRGPDPLDEDGAAIPDAFPIYIEDCGWDWWEFPELVAELRRLTGPHYVEKKASGKSAAQMLRRNKVRVKEVDVHGDKMARAAQVQPLVTTGRVYVREGLARHLLEGDRQGLLGVTAEALASGTGDLDLNDSFVQALQRHTGQRRRRMGVYFPGMSEGAAR